MSVDIQKQLDIRPYSDNRVTTKPVVTAQNSASQSVDEEKSNAAKWMIGLTATAAIAIGGLYLAKHGKLGEGAEKWAKKLFGEGGKGSKASETASTTSTASTTKTPTASTSSTSPTSPTSPTSTTSSSGSPIPNPIPAAVTIAPLVFARKGISRLIKKPGKTLTEIMTEFEQAGVKLEKKGENLLEIKTGSKPDDITKLLFNPDGTLATIQRATKKASEEIFTFENGLLRGVKRRYKDNELSWAHEIKFNDAKKIASETYNFDYKHTVKGELESIENLPNSFSTGQTSSWFEMFETKYEQLPRRFKNAKIYSNVDHNYETARYITPRACKYYKTNLKDIPAKIPSEEFVRMHYPKDLPTFDVIVQDLDVARRISQRTANLSTNSISQKTPRELVESLTGTNRIKKENLYSEIRDICSSSVSDSTVITITRLLEKDMGSAKDIDGEVILHAIRNYKSTLKAYGIEKPEQLEVVVKPLSKCSKNDFIQLLGSKDVVQQKLPGCFDDYGMLDVEFLSSKAGFGHVKDNMSVFDILKDLV